MLTKPNSKKRDSKKPVKKNITYPHISNKKGILNGTPVIDGTRIAVRTIAGYYQMGMSVDEILNTLSHLSYSQVHSALAYYFDHQNEIDVEIRENLEMYNAGND